MGLSERDLEEILKNPNIKIKETKFLNVPNTGVIKYNAAIAEAIDHKKTDKMNKLETRYAQYLDLQVYRKEIVSWMFEPFNLRLASPKCFYRIDFLIINKLNQIELHETKGDWVSDDGLVKFKVAAETFPFFIFKWVTYKNSEFIWRELRNGKWK